MDNAADNRQVIGYYNVETDPWAEGLLGEGDRLVHVPMLVESKEELLSYLASELEFPEHFGGNWDAFSDCMNDLSWVKERRVVLVHEGMPLLDREKDAAAYLDILNQAGKRWLDDASAGHGLKVLFPDNFKEQVETLLAENSEYE